MNYQNLILRWREGDKDSGDTLVRDIYDELQKIAAIKLSKELYSSLSTGDLINEAVIRISKLDRMQFQGREHILAIASNIMRQILIDQARKRNSQKRYHTQVTLTPEIARGEDPLDLLELELVMQELHDIDPVRSHIVEMRYFGGMTINDISVVLELSVSTIERRWQATRIWLQNRLNNGR